MVLTALCLSSLFCLFVSNSAASLCHGACVELDSDTEAVANEGFKLGCISCKRRGEVKAVAIVNWYFKALGEQNFTHVSGS